MFATSDDVAARLGRTLTAEEQAMVPDLLEAATALVAEAAGQTEEWATELDPVPVLLKVVTVGAVVRVLVNPTGAQRVSRQLGSFQHSAAWAAESTGLALTAGEERLVRRVVNETGSASARVGSIAFDPLDYY